ncbi:MAG: sigma-54 dependent transcriptional regulator [Myxococcota bacterium]|nr:sigma-54 dependent transcriptional regulator [Myxococcota bacterium]
MKNDDPVSARSRALASEFAGDTQAKVEPDCYAPPPMSSARGAATNTRLLIVDDDLDVREMLGMVFSGGGQTCELVASAAGALDALSREAFDAVICDVRMEGMDGLELLDKVKKLQPSLPFIVMTAMGEVHDAVTAIKRGAFQYVTKPCDIDELRTMVAGAIGHQRRQDGEDTVRRTPRRADGGDWELIGPGPAMRALHASIDRVAASSAPVLITGETGVGKEIVARAIHARGNRHDRPFVAVNTSAFQEDLIESEVFGHVRGAFTGALHARRGLLTEADGGTLLLDEIGDMPMRMQSKLLRVLQFGEVRPVGSDRAHRIDVRVIAATHRELPALIREGRFREDLYFRLNVLPVFVPPLREHREDIPALAQHFLEEARQRASGSMVRSIDDVALHALMEAPWPGNVRELASAIERAVVFSSEEALRPRHLAAGPPGEAQTPSWQSSHQPPWTLRRMSHAYTQWVLAQTGGNKQRAAEILGIDLSTLYRWQRVHSD